MNMDTIRDRYDLFERREARLPGSHREEGEHTVRYYSDGPGHGWVAWSDLGGDGATADRAIEAELARFRELGRDFEWKLYDYDRPADLKERLRARGFSIGEDEAIMVLDLEELPARLKAGPSVEVVRITEPGLIRGAAAVHAEVWGEDPSPLFAELEAEFRAGPERIAFYEARIEGRTVASAWIRFPEDSPFASLWGGSTLEAYRGRGVYTSLLGERAREALRRGYDWLTIDAGPMSRPIVERLGFRLMAISNPCDSPRG